MKRTTPPVEITAAKGAPSSAEQLFDALLIDSVTEVFNGVLGNMAGRALTEAVITHASLELKDLPRGLHLLDKALRARLGLTACVLERKIVKTLAGKAAVGIDGNLSNTFDFVCEMEKLRKQFLQRKQAGNLPQALE